MEASRELRGTIAQGSSEAMAASYKLYCRNSVLTTDKAGNMAFIAQAAREYFEAKDVMLDVDRIFGEENKESSNKSL